MASSQHLHDPSDSENDDSDEEADAGVYEVERILAECPSEDKMCYLVKWKGYEDRECTWETAESFQDQTTLDEWERQLAKGDTLDEEQIDEVQARMDDFAAEKEQKREERRNKLDARKARIKCRTMIHGATKAQSINTGSHTLKDSTAPTQTTDSKTIERHHHEAKISTPSSSTAPRQSSTIRSKAPSIKSATTKRGRNSPTATKPRNLRKINSAQKKNARNEPVPQMENLISPAELGRKEPAHFLPPAPPYRPKPLIFPSEGRSARAETTPQPSLMSDNALNTSHGGLVDLSRINAPAMKPEASSMDGFAGHQTGRGHHMMESTRTGRTWPADQLLVQLALGQHEVGDVKIAGFPPWLRTILVRLKVDDALCLQFKQALVLKRPEFSDLSQEWQPGRAAYGEVHPFEDTEFAYNSLANHLEEHQAAAIWGHPDPSNSAIALILHSSALPKWRQADYQPLMDRMPRLLVEVRNRAPKGILPPPLLPPAAVKLPPHLSQTAFGAFSQQPLLPPPEQQLPEKWKLAPREARVMYGAGGKDDHIPAIGTVPPSAPMDFDAQSLTEAAQTATKTTEVPTADMKYAKVRSAVPNNFRRKEDFNSLGQNIEAIEQPDWTCDMNHRTMISNSSQKPLVYIAFGTRSPTQAEAVKAWSGKFTATRLIFVEGASENEWKDFCETCGTSPALLLFDSNDPLFCKLDGLGHLLGKFDNLSSFNLTWAEAKTEHAPRYTGTRIFMRGTVLLLSESTLRQPAVARDILAWYEKHSKGKSRTWKLMVKPNVRAWLQHCALRAEDEEVAKQYLEVLFLLHNLGNVIDVTALPDVTKLRSLEESPFSTGCESEGFIIPLPPLAGYDRSPEADSSLAAVACRDEILLRHFVGWSAANVTSHRRFVVIDNEDARECRDTSTYANAKHIVFRSAEQFRRETLKNDLSKKRTSSKKTG